MVNLMSFTLHHTLTGDFTIGQLLDFFESAPRLRKIDLYNAKPTSSGENGRLVSLDHLKRVDIIERGPTSIFLNHLVIPVGAKLKTRLESYRFIIEDHIPRSLDNLKNLSNFTGIHLRLNNFLPHVRFVGPNGRFRMVAAMIDTNTTLVFESLARFDTSKAEWLWIDDLIPPFTDPRQTFLPIKNLRILVLCRCDCLSAFMGALNPNTSPSKEVVCPLLEDLVFFLRTDREFDVQGVIEVAAARASRGTKLRGVAIAGEHVELDVADVLELRKHVLCVEYGHETHMECRESDDSDEED